MGGLCAVAAAFLPLANPVLYVLGSKTVKTRYGPRQRARSKGYGLGVDVFFEFVQHHSNPRAALMVAHGFMELLVSALVDANCAHAKRINSDKRNFTHSAKLVLLNELGTINHDWYKRLDYLRKIRNRAAHEPLFEVTKEHLAVHPLPAHLVGIREITSLSLDRQFIQRLHLMLGEFWNKHNKIFTSVFGPQRLSPSLLFPPDRSSPK